MVRYYITSTISLTLIEHKILSHLLYLLGPQSDLLLLAAAWGLVLSGALLAEKTNVLLLDTEKLCLAQEDK